MSAGGGDLQRTLGLVLAAYVCDVFVVRMARAQGRLMRRDVLAPGEMLFLYTDGVTEAVNVEGEQFRMARLVDIAQAQAGRTPQELMLDVIGRSYGL